MIKSNKDKNYEEEEFDFESRIVSSSETPEDYEAELSLRPKTLNDYVGQKKIKEKLAISMQAAKMRGEALDHILLHGPPGLGKDHPFDHHCRRNGRRHSYHIGTGYRKARCACGASYQLKADGHSVYRRNSPSAAAGRGNSISGYGGLQP